MLSREYSKHCHHRRHRILQSCEATGGTEESVVRSSMFHERSTRLVSDPSGGSGGGGGGPRGQWPPFCSAAILFSTCSVDNLR